MPHFKIQHAHAAARIVLVALWLSGFIAATGLAAKEERETDLVEDDFEAQYYEAVSYLARNDEESLKKAPRLLKKLAVAGHARSQDTLGSLYRQGVGVLANDKQAARWFAEAAEKRFPNSMLSLAEMRMEGVGVEQDYGKARELLEQLIDPASKFEARVEEFAQLRRIKARAHYLLGEIHSNGRGVETNMDRALELFEAAAHAGDQDATMYLAIAYAEGKKVDKRIDKAKEYFELLNLQSSDALRRSLDTTHFETEDATEFQNLQEYGEAMSQQISQSILGMQTQFAKQVLHADGEDFDAEFAAGLLEMAADGGDAEAQSELGILYYRGMGVEEDLEKATQLIADSAAQGWVMAQYNLAVLLSENELPLGERFAVRELLEFAAEQGLYAAQVQLEGNESHGVLNSTEAKDLCLRKTDEGDPRAFYSLARRKMLGWMVEVEEDRQKLVELFRKSADYGYSRAQYTMGLLYMSGEEVEQNVESGFWWLKSAASQGHPVALHHMGVCYASGIVVQPDAKQAFYYFSKSAELGLDAAKNSLAVFYNEGIGVVQNEWKASELYLEAADEGDPTAAFNIGNCYLEGKGVRRNVEKGLEWIAKSAEQGNLVACDFLARIYEEGFLAESDAVEVAYWQEKAASMGNRSSMKRTALNYFYGRGIPKNRGKASFWISEYLNHTGPMDTSRLTLEGEYESHERVQELLPKDYSALIVYADLMADSAWSGYDPEEAYSVLKDLAGKGFWGAKYRLADLLANHDFPKANPKRGYSLFKSLYDDNRTADLEIRRAYAAKSAYQLFTCTINGVGIKASDGRALKWLEISAGGGLAQSQFEWGKRLVTGNGVARDFEGGVVWLMAAADQGHLESREKLAQLNLDRPIANLERETIIEWLKEQVDGGSGKARNLLRRYGVEYKEPKRRSRSNGDEKIEIDPYAPIEAV